MLLSHGADINAQDKEGVTPLMAAVYGTAGHNRVSANGIAALLEGIDASKIDFTLTEKVRLDFLSINRTFNVIIF
jgi:ankyrin repeat protein